MRRAGSATRMVLGRALAVCLIATTACSQTTVYQAPSPSAVRATLSPTPSPAPTPQPTPDLASACTTCWPLNGTAVKPGSDTGRRPLVVKIDDAPQGRPHYGLSQADMVFELLVEGFVTRLAVVFHSQDPATIGNVRSARLSDRSLTPMVRGALVYSGTSAYEMPLIQQDASQGRYIDFSADYTGGYYRVGFRPGPYNMFTSAAAMRQILATDGFEEATDIPKWGFLAYPEHPAQVAGMSAAAPATDITIPYRSDTSLVSYQYDPATRTYARWQNSAGRPVREVDGANNTPVAASNVVIIQTEIWEVPEIIDAAGAHAHDMRLVGTGAASVFRDGLRQEGTWSRSSDRAPFVFSNVAGQQILLSPGQTWFHIVPTDWQVTSH